ncbi:MAG: heat-inducible transcriptional repressor HrcA [Endomicrobiales bacterium]|nr:heat-inducible transcriptional repressor HrcA [Endomicrobiales bacterium]
MRQIAPKTLEDRKRKVLQAVIHQYIKTAKPVGSKVLIEEHGFDLSPATIRNIMADLENAGYLSHPHTSAGRIPTDKGYRLYVDSLFELQKLVISEKERITKGYHGKVKELQDVLMQTSHVLSGLSKYYGFVLAPKNEVNCLKHIELIPISDSQLLAIMVTDTGIVKHHIVNSIVNREKIAYVNKLLNKKMCGMSMAEAKKNIAYKIAEAEQEHKEVLMLAKNIGKDIFDLDEELYIDGALNILSLPEFRDYEPMRCLLKIGDEKKILSQAVGKDFLKDGVNVLIGAETECKELANFSVISAVYKDGEKPLGVLGIVGPKRMEYAKMMSIVGTVTEIVNKMLGKMGE